MLLYANIANDSSLLRVSVYRAVLSALLVGSERIPLVTSVEPEPESQILCRVEGDDLTVVGPFYQKVRHVARKCRSTTHPLP
jgi:hypothetical protein